MSGGWAGSTRRLRLPPDWPNLRRQRLELDGYQCTAILPSGVRCPRPAEEVDHIRPMTDDHSLAGLQSLCRVCHRAKSGSEGGRASGAQAKRRAAAKYRPAERHPGLIA